MQAYFKVAQGTQVPCSLPIKTGISLKPQYYKALLEAPLPIGFLEIHAENYLSAGGPRIHFLQRLREKHPISIHGVGLSIGGHQPLDIEHLKRVAELIKWSEPLIFSEHLAWSSHGHNYYNDLLPVRYDEKSLQRVCEHVEQVQNTLQRKILIENPSSYIRFSETTMTECEFLSELVKTSGCGLLLDVNNIIVSSHNLNYAASEYIQQFPMHAVGQFHLAGHENDASSAIPLKIDSHNQPIDDSVWSLFDKILPLSGDHPTLIERDGNLPPLNEMIAEADTANTIRQQNYPAETAL